MREIIAKKNPEETLLSHSTRSVLVAQNLLSPKGRLSCVLNLLGKYCDTSKENLFNYILFNVATHDVGKINPVFQYKINNDDAIEKFNIKNFRHEAYSIIYFTDFWAKKNFNGQLKKISIFTSEQHHGSRNRNIDTDIKMEAKKKLSESYDFLTHFYNKYPFCDFSIKDNAMSIVQLVILGVVMISDWLASMSNEILPNIDVENEHEINTELQKIIKRSGFVNQNQIDKEMTFEEILNVPNAILHPIQAKLVEVSEKLKKSNMIIIEDIMGGGKTEAAFYCVSKMCSDNSGMVYALPTMATSNAMFERVSNFLEPDRKVVLLHSMREIIKNDTMPNMVKTQDEELLELNDFLNQSSRRGLFNQFVVCTIDQLVSSVLKNKYAPIKLISLIGKTVILDEVHSYDCYTSTIIEEFLEWCGVLDIKVILLSATLTKTKRKSFLRAYSNYTIPENINLSDSYPLITALLNEGVKEWGVKTSYSKTYQIKTLNILNNSLKIVKEIEKKHNEYPEWNIVYFTNTVANGQEITEILMNMGYENVILIHSKFTLNDRLKKEKDCLEYFGKKMEKRRKGYIVITTQVIECSLDVDFDYLFTDIAPQDILYQRGGREHRFKLPYRTGSFIPMTVFLPEEKRSYGTSLLYDKAILDATSDYLKEHSFITLPNDIRKSIETVYSPLNTKEWQKRIIDEKVESNSAKITCISHPLSSDNKLLYIGNDDFDDNGNEFFSIRKNNENFRCLILNNNQPAVKLNNIKKEDFKKIISYSLSSKLPNAPKEVIETGKLKNTVVLRFEEGILEENGYKYTYDTKIGFEYERM